MASQIKDRIVSDMKEAMKSGQKEKLGVIRLILAAFKQREVDERIELTDELALAILNKLVKQRRDSISQYSAAGRNDLAEQEQAEITVIQNYLPAQLSEAEIREAIANAISQTQASSPKDMGKVMSLLREPLQGRADMAVVSQWIKEKLQ